MSFKLWSVTIAWLVVFGLLSAVGFGVVAAGAPLALLIGAALATPALVLRDSADAKPTSYEESRQVPRVGDVIPGHAAA